MTIAEVVKNHVTAVLHQCNGNKTEAAKILGVDRRTIYRVLNGGGFALSKHMSAPTVEPAPQPTV